MEYDYDRAFGQINIDLLRERFPELYEVYLHFVNGARIEIISNFSSIKLRVMKGNNLVLDGFTGSFGQITAVASPDGDRILKQKITSMTNPNTEGQASVRSNFKKVVALGSAITTFLRLYFKKLKVTHSNYNSFVSLNSPKKDEVSGETPEFNIEDVVFTRGDLYNPSIILDSENSSDSGNGKYEVVMTWTVDPSSSIQNGDDEVFVLELNTESYDWKVSDVGDSRSDGTSSWEVTIPSSGEVLVVPFMVDGSTGETHAQKAIAKLGSDGVLTAI